MLRLHRRLCTSILDCRSDCRKHQVFWRGPELSAATDRVKDTLARSHRISSRFLSAQASTQQPEGKQGFHFYFDVKPSQVPANLFQLPALAQANSTPSPSCPFIFLANEESPPAGPTSFLTGNLCSQGDAGDPYSGRAFNPLHQLLLRVSSYYSFFVD